MPFREPLIKSGFKLFIINVDGISVGTAHPAKLARSASRAQW